MIYTTGTVNTVSGSAIVKGTGTKFKNNNPAINIGMTILIKSGNTNIPYMIKSVNSDTELVLAQPALATATNTTFSIHITEPDNNSDAARTMVAINSYTQYFLDAMNTWMTQTGQTKVEMPNGEIVTLDSIKKMQGDIANKFDKNGGEVTGTIRIKNGGIFRINNNENTSDSYILTNNNGSTQIGNAYSGIEIGSEKLKFKNNDVIVNKDIGSSAYKNIARHAVLPENGDVAVQGYADYRKVTGWANVHNFPVGITAGIARGEQAGKPEHPIVSMITVRGWIDDSGIAASSQIYITPNGRMGFRYPKYNATDKLYYLTSVDSYSTSNTTVDSNGFIKRASPVININSDGTFTTNDESEGATVTRIAKGEYLIEGVLGFNADAGWGGVDGGIEIPLDVNKQPLIWVDSEVNEDGSILVKTYHRTHPNAPEFANNEIDGFNDGDPIDIPDGRFISVRVQMPEQSIYNVRMREMEEAQKAEEERRQKEED
ncbi:phage tail fiber protein [Proteus vulgaris]|uniref:phage tail fiber protein n=1 Tax=Proteus vulgaris TaxID=585 RepID=UPI000F4F7B19|nr:hypothetical protein [Proteus vulgaris]AYY82118.1 hypothetical protein EGX81_15060 [Proteus vulgaris]